MSCFLRLSCAAALIAVVAGCAARGPAAPDFTLTSDTGQPWSLAAQRGRPVLLTFGFTHCADTCPATLAKLARLRTNALGPHGRDVEIVLVTVDPNRDTPAVLHAFVSRFGPSIVGLTGDPGRIRAVENAYHVWAQSVPGNRRGGNYDVAHAAVIYLIDAAGRIRGLHEDDESEADLARAVREMLG
ncbi:MAG TPA: SCO family protein [Candidatus Tumulicola sp.]|jgi:protein SCO1/2